MDNSDENKNNINDKPEGESEEIPYWLQGFEENIPDETTPIASDTKEGEPWIKESGNATSDEDLPPDSDDDVETPSPQIDNLDEPQSPDSVLDENDLERMEISEDETSFENEITGALDDHEITDEIEIDAFADDELAEPVEPEPDELPSPEGFVDISDLDLSESAHQEDEAILEVEAKEGELPEWLQEMISEPETPDFKESDESVKLPEEELVEESVDALDTNWDKEHLEGEIVENELSPLEDIDEVDITEVDQELETIIAIADEDTTPISTIKTEDISSDEEESESIVLDSDEQLDELSETSEVKYTLEDLKSYLNQKDIQQALNIVNELDDEITDFDEIMPLLLEATENDTRDNSDLWEVIGDIALKQKKSHDALNAYAKAIKYLIIKSEADDETS